MNEPATPQETLAKLLNGYWLPQAIYAAVKLGLPDILHSGPQTPDALANRVGAQPRALYRLLRALASMGIFAENEQKQFVMTPMSDCLRSDVPGGQAALAMTSGGLFYPVWTEMLYSLQTGKEAFSKVYGAPIFDYLAKNPEWGRLFDETMVGVHGRETPAIVEAFAFPGANVIADIGGGNGSLITAILARHREKRGILFDLPGVTERAKSTITAAGLDCRCQAIGGNFFEAVPAGADVYISRHIIHDWDDDQSLAILKNIRKIIPASGKLYLIETVIPPGNEPSFGKLLDLAMLVLPGGIERTEAEYRDLYHSAGFQLSRIIPTHSPVQLIEGTPT